MIVKIELLKQEGNNRGGWRFVDRVNDVEIRTLDCKTDDGNESWKRELMVLKDGELCMEKITVLGDQSAYLLNDEGKTIERIN